MGAALSTHRFGSLEAPGHTGMTHPEMQVFPSCRVSQRQRDESYALSPHGPPFPGVSRGFSLTLSLTHSPAGRARSHVLEEKKEEAREREGGKEDGEGESTSTFTLPLSAGVRGSGKQGVCSARWIYIYLLGGKKKSLFF